MTDWKPRRVLLALPLLLLPLSLLTACGTHQPTHEAGPVGPVRGSLPPAVGSDAPGAPGVNPPSSSSSSGTPQAPDHYDPIPFPQSDPVVTVDVPRGWTREDSTVSNQRSDFVDPTGKVFLRLDSSPFTGDSAKANFEAVETDFASHNKDYQQISLNDIPCPDGASDCADWQFTFDDDGTPRQVIDRAYVGDDGTQIALYYSAPYADRTRTFDRVKPAFDRAAYTLTFRQ